MSHPGMDWVAWRLRGSDSMGRWGGGGGGGWGGWGLCREGGWPGGGAGGAPPGGAVR